MRMRVNTGRSASTINRAITDILVWAAVQRDK
jgi:hypothetical protein